jgi:hypothetical protein
MSKIFRIGHQVFTKIETNVSVLSNTLKDGFELHSESGRVTKVPGVQRARSPDGQELMIAPEGAVIEHPEHGTMELPQGVYQVQPVGEAVPQEASARTMEFESPLESLTSLTREQLD